MPQTLLTVFEDRQTKLTLTHDQKEDILSFRSIMGDRISLSYDGYLHVRHYVGFISKGKTRLQILPKVYENTGFKDEAEQRKSMSIMQNLLRFSEFGKVLELPDQSSSAEQTDIMEFLISIFAAKVLSAYSRQMNREYISISENSGYIKGRIDFAANLRENPFRKDLHIVNFQSFEHDNLINNVIKTVCIRLIRLTNDADNKKNLKKALIFLDDAQEVFLSNDLFNAARFTRLNMPFKQVFEMAKMFFFNLAPQSYQGNDTICSFLIPLNKLFEYYLCKLFETFQDGTSVSYQKMFAFARGVDNNFDRSIFPDIILYKENRPILIADAKYKNPEYEYKISAYTNISQADIYQVFVYAKACGVSNVALIYPQFGNDTPPMKIKAGDSDNKVFITIGCVDIKNAAFEEESAKLKKTILKL